MGETRFPQNFERGNYFFALRLLLRFLPPAFFFEALRAPFLAAARTTDFFSVIGIETTPSAV